MIDVHGLPEWGVLTSAPLSAARVAVAGVPYDRSATYRRGARHAPAHIRRLSAVMPPVDERGRCFGDLTVCDLGDLELGNSAATGWPAVAERLAEVPPGAFLTVFGGDHCTAIPVLVAQARRHPDLAVLPSASQEDGHASFDEIDPFSWTVGFLEYLPALELNTPQMGLQSRKYLGWQRLQNAILNAGRLHGHGRNLQTRASETQP